VAFKAYDLSKQASIFLLLQDQLLILKFIRHRYWFSEKQEQNVAFAPPKIMLFRLPEPQYTRAVNSTEESGAIGF
jgi:hypothetical protein